MSVSAMVETYDMPMTDYNEDGDIPMGGSSSENWFQPLPHMDEDAHNIVAFSDSQEVDMMAFEETTTEYEMVDEAAQPQDTDIDTHVFDAEVYDVTIHPSPLPSGSGDIAQSHLVQSEDPGNLGTITDQPQLGDASNVTTPHDSNSAVTQDFLPSETAQSHDASLATSEPHVAGHSPAAEVFGTIHEHREERVTTEVTSEQAQPQGEVASTVDEHSSLPSEHVATSLYSDNTTDDPNSDGDGKLPISQINDASHQVKEEEIPSEHDGDEQALNVLQTTEEIAGNIEENTAEQSEPTTAQQVYVQPPPPIFLSLQVASAEGDQPDFVLFNLPESSSHASEEPLLLLQHHPSLFYEPVSAVFDAFRQEEYFSHLEELSEAEMALNAHDLQLVISEDNIYSREVSLQDLYAMHQGVGLPGHLRLTLQSIMPRFITRYNLLRDQVTRLVLGEEAGETLQHESPSTSEEESEIVYEPQVHAAPDETQGLAQNNETKGPETAEAAERAQEVATLDSTSHPDERAEEPAFETESGNESEHNATDAIAGGVEDNANEESDHDEDASGESDDAAYDLDADVIHAQADDKVAEPSPDEQDTEYAGEVEPHEEADEGYGDDFQEDGADGTGTAETAVESTAFSENARSEVYAGDEQHESGPEPNDAQSGQISVSHSTSTSSFYADESSWEDAAGEDDDSHDVEEGTNQSIQQVTATVFDEEGKLTDGAVQVAEEGGDDFGDDFGDDDFGGEDFEESAEGTLADPNEETEELLQNIEASEHVEKDADTASREVLAESENFVSNLENEIDANDTKEKTVLSESVRTESHDHHSITTTDAPPEPDLLHKISSKRSLDDADLDGIEETASLSSSPDSKRTRTL
ncbi:hypothetical protein A7U60_g8828 [Sanghuangporus baumii]|uniref:Uncharacterized protein n=1 Tax=Sanghuangporus baumii TaxID=108892 RepID=A0A9Q5MXW4_SANBA|nr:hypothetical protein A7U60_g8828 [Sanghuangporus baumii]